MFLRNHINFVLWNFTSSEYKIIADLTVTCSDKYQVWSEIFRCSTTMSCIGIATINRYSTYHTTKFKLSQSQAKLDMCMISTTLRASRTHQTTVRACERCASSKNRILIKHVYITQSYAINDSILITFKTLLYIETSFRTS